MDKIKKLITEIKLSHPGQQVDLRNWWNYFVTESGCKDTMLTVISYQPNGYDGMLALYTFTDNNETIWLSLEDQDTIIDSCEVCSAETYMDNLEEMIVKYKKALNVAA